MHEPLFPWVEANQGFLSVLALALALGVAAFEHWRVLSERREALTKTVRSAVNLIAKLEQRCAGAIEEIRLTGKSADPNAVCEDIKRAVDSLRILAGTSGTGDVADALLRASDACGKIVSPWGAWDRARLDRTKVGLATVSDGLDRCLPPRERRRAKLREWTPKSNSAQPPPAGHPPTME